MGRQEDVVNWHTSSDRRASGPPPGPPQGGCSLALVGILLPAGGLIALGLGEAAGAIARALM